MPNTICVALPGSRNTATVVSTSLRPHSNSSNHQYSGSYVSHLPKECEREARRGQLEG